MALEPVELSPSAQVRFVFLSAYFAADWHLKQELQAIGFGPHFHAAASDPVSASAFHDSCGLPLEPGHKQGIERPYIDGSDSGHNGN